VKREVSSWDWWDPVEEKMVAGEPTVYFHEDYRHYDFDVPLIADDCDPSGTEHDGCHHRSEHGSDQTGKYYDDYGKECKRNCFRYEKFSNLLDPYKLEQETIPPVVTCPTAKNGDKIKWGKVQGIRPVQFAPPVSKDPVQMKMRLSTSFGFESRLALLQDPDFKLTSNKVGVFVVSEVKAKGNAMHMGPNMEDLISTGCTIDFNLFTQAGDPLQPWTWRFQRLINYSPVIEESWKRPTMCNETEMEKEKTRRVELDYIIGNMSVAMNATQCEPDCYHHEYDNADNAYPPCARKSGTEKCNICDPHMKGDMSFAYRQRALESRSVSADIASGALDMSEVQFVPLEASKKLEEAATEARRLKQMTSRNARRSRKSPHVVDASVAKAVDTSDDAQDDLEGWDDSEDARELSTDIDIVTRTNAALLDEDVAQPVVSRSYVDEITAARRKSYIDADKDNFDTDLHTLLDDDTHRFGGKHPVRRLIVEPNERRLAPQKAIEKLVKNGARKTNSQSAPKDIKRDTKSVLGSFMRRALLSRDNQNSNKMGHEQRVSNRKLLARVTSHSEISKFVTKKKAGTRRLTVTSSNGNSLAPREYQDYHRNILRKLESAQFSLYAFVKRDERDLDLLDLINSDARQKRRKLSDKHRSGALVAGIVDHDLMKQTVYAASVADMHRKATDERIASQQRLLREYVQSRRSTVLENGKPRSFNAQLASELRNLIARHMDNENKKRRLLAMELGLDRHEREEAVRLLSRAFKEEQIEKAKAAEVEARRLNKEVSGKSSQVSSRVLRKSHLRRLFYKCDSQDCQMKCDVTTELFGSVDDATNCVTTSVGGKGKHFLEYVDNGGPDEPQGCEVPWSPGATAVGGPNGPPGPDGPGLNNNMRCVDVLTFGAPELFNDIPKGTAIKGHKDQACVEHVCRVINMSAKLRKQMLDDSGLGECVCTTCAETTNPNDPSTGRKNDGSFIFSEWGLGMLKCQEWGIELGVGEMYVDYFAPAEDAKCNCPYQKSGDKWVMDEKRVETMIENNAARTDAEYDERPSCREMMHHAFGAEGIYRDGQHPWEVNSKCYEAMTGRFFWDGQVVPTCKVNQTYDFADVDMTQCGEFICDAMYPKILADRCFRKNDYGLPFVESQLEIAGMCCGADATANNDRVKEFCNDYAPGRGDEIVASITSQCDTVKNSGDFTCPDFTEGAWMKVEENHGGQKHTRYERDHEFGALMAKVPSTIVPMNS
jgi:hypothetical protein